MKYVIVGGVAGGATAAARIRRNTEKAEIILFERGEYISYANCGLPYYIGGVIQDRDRLFVQTPEAFSTRFRIDVRVCPLHTYSILCSRPTFNASSISFFFSPVVSLIFS